MLIEREPRFLSPPLPAALCQSDNSDVQLPTSTFLTTYGMFCALLNATFPSVDILMKHVRVCYCEAAASAVEKRRI